MARIKAKAEKLHQEALAQAEKIQAAEVIELSAKSRRIRQIIWYNYN